MSTSEGTRKTAQRGKKVTKEKEQCIERQEHVARHEGLAALQQSLHSTAQKQGSNKISCIKCLMQA